MADKLTFRQEISNLMSISHGNSLTHCIQCGTCSGTCPAVAAAIPKVTEMVLDALRKKEMIL